jgi:hypothetical protein
MAGRFRVPFSMKADIHPRYEPVEIRCACGRDQTLTGRSRSSSVSATPAIRSMPAPEVRGYRRSCGQVPAAHGEDQAAQAAFAAAAATKRKLLGPACPGSGPRGRPLVDLAAHIQRFGRRLGSGSCAQQPGRVRESAARELSRGLWLKDCGDRPGICGPWGAANRNSSPPNPPGSSSPNSPPRVAASNRWTPAHPQWRGCCRSHRLRNTIVEIRAASGANHPVRRRSLPHVCALAEAEMAGGAIDSSPSDLGGYKR